MTDNYQAVYDAVRSRFNSCDVASILSSAVSHAFGISWVGSRLEREFFAVAMEMQRPFYLLRPKLSRDGDQWCALYGENIQDGLSGWGRTPAEAAYAFDAAFHKGDHAKAIKV